MIYSFSNVNVVFDGNSIVSGHGVTTSLAQQVLNLIGGGVTGTNCAVASQSWRMMAGADAGSCVDADAAWVGGKYNILVLWETTNAVAHYGRSPEEGVQDCLGYMQARQLRNPWRVVLLTTIPRNVARDAENRAWDAYARVNYRRWGVDALIDTRMAGSPYNFNGETDAGFQATQSLWQETSAWVHPNDAGLAVVAPWIVRALRGLPSAPRT